ncbi:MAG: PQQ-binding-like beta-propeller repeat protein [Actinobacteria bacterium]|nr:PQQ-binding-like beta-propeller repeat protein [Actinomycetota bacterium]
MDTENLFASVPVHATSWVDRWSIHEPGVKADMIETGHGRGRLAVDHDSIWVANATSETLTRIDRRTGVAEWRSDLDHQPLAVAAGRDAAWVLADNGWLWRFRADGTSEGIARTGHGPRDLACDGESAWVLQGDGDLAAFDQSTGEVTVETKIPRGARELLVADGGLIALTGGGDQVCRIGRERGDIEARGKLPDDGTVAAVHDGVLWVACSRLRSSRWGALARVDLGTMAVETVHELPNAPRAIVGGGGHLWVACGRRGDRASSIVRVEPGSGEFTPWAQTEFTVHDLTLAGDEIAAAVGMRISIDVGGGS